MNDNFFGFSSESFEQFARAIAMAELGPNVVAFGDGPDGGREAMFDGEVNYRRKGPKNWNGYGVIQAKYKSKPETTEKNQAWVLDHLEKELKLFHTSEKRNPKPKYYLLITNVELSAATNGGRDQVDKLFRSYSRKLRLQDYAVWDANQLRPVVAQHESVRNSFLQFFTTGDYLANMLKLLKSQEPNLDSIFTGYLIRELRNDQQARLDQAGNMTDHRIPLSKLFFDIPAAQEALTHPPEEQPENSGHLPPGVLAEMLRAASRKLDPLGLESELLHSDRPNPLVPNRYLLQGGPGSGKSTISQFLAQIHRAAILTRRQGSLLAADIRDSIEQFQEFCDRERLVWPNTPRYPFRVDLNQFAKKLASKEDHVESFGKYLLTVVRGDYSLDHETLLAWFDRFPSLIVLDGLDEVPSTSNRTDVIKTIQEFLDEIRLRNADVFVVATTRVQGYHAEFAGDQVAIRYLQPLSLPRALHYVRAYANARYGASDPDLAERLYSTIETKSKSLLTKELLGTPLQVTLLVTVVAANGEPGDNRWNLYESYYSTIYKRELQKAVPDYIDVLRNQQVLVAKLHHIVGFWLQYQGEITAQSSTSIPLDTFRRIAEVLLSRQGFEGDEHAQLVNQLIGCAAQRLIFLTSRVAGELAFEVRSLQEFMASECLMTGDSEIIRQRLRAIATSTPWRNVLLFAAHKCFADHHVSQVQDYIRSLTFDLNDADTEPVYMRDAGSELALDLLQSGIATGSPTFVKHLTSVALELIERCDLPATPGDNSAVDLRLAGVYSLRTGELFRKKIESRIRQNWFRDSLGAWPLLLRMAHVAKWAEELCVECWPQQLEELRRLQASANHIPLVDTAAEALNESLSRVTPSEAHNLLRNWVLQRTGHSTLALRSWLRIENDSAIKIPIRLSNSLYFTCGLALTAASPPADNSVPEFLLPQSPEIHPSWLPLQYLPQFREDPTLAGLIAVLHSLASEPHFGKTDVLLLMILPWPMAVALKHCEDSQQLRDLATQLGKRASVAKSNWQNMEREWERAGVDPTQDFVTYDVLEVLAPTSRNPGPPEIALGRMWSSFKSFPANREQYSAEVDHIFETIKATKYRDLQSFMAETIHEFPWFGQLVSPKHSRAALRFVARDGLLLLRPPLLADLQKREVGEWVVLFSAIGTRDRLSQHPYFANRTQIGGGWLAFLQQVYTTAAQRSGKHGAITKRRVLGLLGFLSGLACDGQQLGAIPKEVLQFHRFLDPVDVFAALLVRLSQRDLDQAEIEPAIRTLRELMSDATKTTVAFHLFTTLEKHLGDHQPLEKFLLRLREEMPEHAPSGRAQCDRLLRRMLDLRPSPLHEPNALRQLKLPDVTNLVFYHPN